MSENQIWAQRSALGNWKQVPWLRNVISSLMVIYGVVSMNSPKRKTLITRRIVIFVCKCFWLFPFKPFFLSTLFPYFHPQYQIEVHHYWTATPKSVRWYELCNRSKASWCPSAWSTGVWDWGEPLLLQIPHMGLAHGNGLPWEARGGQATPQLASAFLGCSQSAARGCTPFS